jgi:hypothetical protein
MERGMQVGWFEWAFMKRHISVIYEGVYSYRNLPMLVAGIGATVTGMVSMFFITYVMIFCNGHRPDWLGGAKQQIPLLGRVVFVIVGLPISGVMVWFGSKILREIVAATEVGIRVDLLGVVLGRQLYSWDDISWIGGQRGIFNPLRFMLVFQLRKNGYFAIPVKGLLDRHALDSILFAVATFVVPSYSNLAVGGTLWWLQKNTLPGLPDNK